MRYAIDWLRVQLRKDPIDGEVAFLWNIVNRDPVIASDAERQRLAELPAHLPQLGTTREIVIAGVADEVLHRLAAP